MIEVWELLTNSDKYLSIAPIHNYFNDHFVGMPMANEWTPPPIEIFGKSKRKPDLASWMLSAPVISEKAKEILLPLIDEYVEVLHLTTIRSTHYYAVNVTFLADCLDLSDSRLAYEEDGKTVRIVYEYAFLPEMIPKAPIFKLTQAIGTVFVTRPFIDLVLEHGLRGFSFGDPTLNGIARYRPGRGANIIGS